MKATIQNQVSNARQPDNKELVSAYSVVSNLTTEGKTELREIVTARFYMGRSSSASVVYCCLWVHGNAYTSGKGSAGGYGYDKKSAALAEAVTSAGIYLDEDISGRGESAMYGALEAITKAAGAVGDCLVVSHG